MYFLLSKQLPLLNQICVKTYPDLLIAMQYV